ncbi:equilibrative nucleoside transporter 3 [Echinococcus multilocularis]|uniref:Equilibrative nucleoside transporter 3 n=1 Tax=Echinococcus multilocularis TaxID=6211 RepID=A0A068Y1Q3_ECHMU|nr:equilibrative nucleoside transporter 3 [Echinococcus multilocularis]
MAVKADEMNEKREGDVLMCNAELETGHLDQGKPKDKSLPESVDPLSPVYRTELQKVFFSYLTIASLIPTTLASFVNLMIKDCLPVFFRVITSAVVMLCMFIITTILTRVVTGTNVFFIITLVTVVINNIGSAINQGSIYGLFPVLPGCNSRAFLEGQAVAGIIAAAANLITIASATDPLDVGFAYFLIGVCIIALTIGLFIILFRNPYFLYYWKNKGTKRRTDNTPWSVKLRRTAASLWHAMWGVRWTGFTLLFTLAVTLAVFPSVYVLLVPNNFDENSQWHTKYFLAVTVFLCYNVFDYVGRMFVGWIKWPKFEQKKLLLSMAVLRAILIPLSLLCNINSKRFPTVFYHDSIPTILVGLLVSTMHQDMHRRATKKAAALQLQRISRWVCASAYSYPTELWPSSRNFPVFLFSAYHSPRDPHLHITVTIATGRVAYPLYLCHDLFAFGALSPNFPSPLPL